MAEIRFRGSVPPEAREQAAGFASAEVRLTGDRGHSVRELDERVTAVHAAVAGELRAHVAAIRVAPGLGLGGGEGGWTAGSRQGNGNEVEVFPGAW